nr:hypothetical protein [Tanacetum cinerariifolium]
MQSVASPSLDYVPGPEHPSPDYMPGPEHPPSLIDIPYVLGPKYPEYLAPSDDETPLVDQPLPADVSPTAASPGYVADSDPDEDAEEDPEDDHADYPADGGDGDDEPSDDDDDDVDDTDGEDEEPFEDEEDEEEEEHLALADSFAIPIVDPILPARDTEALEADEPTPIPRSPYIIIPLSQTRLRRARKTIRLEPSMAAEIRMRVLLPSTSRMIDIPKADVLPRKRAFLTTPALEFKVRESSAAGAARQLGPTEFELRRYRVEQAGVDHRVIELDTTVRQRTDEFKIRLEETAWPIVVRHESEKTTWPIMVRHAYVKMAWPSVRPEQTYLVKRVSIARILVGRRGTIHAS